ncbi:MAG: flagellar basal-body rod protein FlgF [Pseudomonadota bacterium]
MDRVVYVAMTGAKHTMRANQVNTNNLANINTTGFRGDLAAFQSKPIEGAGYPSRINSVTQSNGADFTPGSLITTGRELDVAVKGEGWIAVQTADGGEAYTRAGDFTVNNAGMLLTSAGQPVLGNGGPIAVPPFSKLEIGKDGTISVLPVGQAPSTLAVVDRIKLVNPPREQLNKTAEGLFKTADGATQAADAKVTLASGVLETSNVNGVSALVNMIELSRHLEVQVKLIKQAEENDAATAQVMRVG